MNAFSGWVIFFFSKRERANQVAKKILEEIVPRFGLPLAIGSDNGPIFANFISLEMPRVLGQTGGFTEHISLRVQGK